MQKRPTDCAPATRRRLPAPKLPGILLLLLLPLILFMVSCNGNKPAGNSGSNQPTPTASPTASAAQQAKLAIDGDRAFEHVRRQVEIGPRPAGSAELGKARDYIVG